MPQAYSTAQSRTAEIPGLPNALEEHALSQESNGGIFVGSYRQGAVARMLMHILSLAWHSLTVFELCYKI